MSDVTSESATLTFEDFDLSEEIKSGIRAAGFSVPSPIQAQAIPAVLGGHDIVAQAHTGTGKTAAFGLPSMSMMDMNRGVSLLVIAPTRELATQVSDELYRLGSKAGVRPGIEEYSESQDEPCGRGFSRGRRRRQRSATIRTSGLSVICPADHG